MIGLHLCSAEEINLLTDLPYFISFTFKLLYKDLGNIFLIDQAVSHAYSAFVFFLQIHHRNLILKDRFSGGGNPAESELTHFRLKGHIIESNRQKEIM